MKSIQYDIGKMGSPRTVLVWMWVTMLCFTSFSSNAQWVETGYRNFDDRIFTLNSHHGILFASTWPKFYKSSNSGVSWELIDPGAAGPMEYITDIHSVNDRLYVSASQGVFVSDDDGMTWSTVPDLRYGSRFMVTDGTNLYSTNSDDIHKSTDNGATWMPLTPVFSGLFAGLVVAGANVVASTTGGEIHVTSNQGASWTKTADLGSHTFSMTAIGMHVFVATFDNGIQHSTDGGLTWSPLPSAPTGYFVTVAASGGLLFASNDQSLLRSDDEGATWTTVSDLASFQLVTHGTQLLILKPSYGLIESSDDGLTWNQFDGMWTRPPIGSVAVVGSTHLAGTYQGIFRSTDNGDTWTASHAGIGQIYVSDIVSMGTTFFASVPNSGVYRSTDDGQTWVLSSTGLTDLGVTCLHSDGTTLYVGTFNNGVYRSTNQGLSWTFSGLPGIDILNLGSTAGGAVYASSFHQPFVYRSLNSGVIWSSIPTLVPGGTVYSMLGIQDKLYVGTSAGIHYLAVNDTWTELNASLQTSRIMSMCTDGTTLFFARNKSTIFGGVTSIDGYIAGSFQAIVPNLNTASIPALTVVNSVLYGAVEENSGIGTYWKTNVVLWPVISMLQPSRGTVGSVVKIQGANFNPVPLDNTVKFGNFYGTVLSATPTELRVSVPSTQGSVPVSVTVNGTTVVSATPYAIRPKLLGFTPTSGTMGAIFTVMGTGFPTTGPFEMRVNDVLMGVGTRTTTAITGSVGVNVSTGPISLLFSDTTIVTPTPFKVIPVITSIQPTTGAAGTLVTIYGNGFEPIFSNNAVSFAGAPATVTSKTLTYIQAVAPAGIHTGSISVSTAGGKAYSMSPFTYLPLPVNCFTDIPKPAISVMPVSESESLLQSSSPGGNQWYRTGIPIEGAVDPILSVQVDGVYSVQVTIDGCQSLPSDPVNILVTGIEASKPSITVFPNPATESLFVTTDVHELDFTITNALGQPLYCGRLDHSSRIDVSQLPPGLYFLRITTPDGAPQAYKFLKL